MSEVSWTSDIESRDEIRQKKRMAVLKTAARLFNERGYDRTSLDDIAAALNVSKRTLYYYIKNKEEILFECNRLAFVFMDEALREAHESDKPPLEMIKTLLSNYAELLSNEFGACLVLSKDQVLCEESRTVLRDGRKELDYAVRDLIQAGIDDGSIAPCDPRVAAAALFGALNWVPHWYEGGKDLTYAEISDQYISLFIEGLRVR